jgi:hypothetical protein
MKYTMLKVREDDVTAIRCLMTERRKERTHAAASKRYRTKVAQFLHTNEEFIRDKVRRNPKTLWIWGQIVTQELIMWADIAKPVAKDEFSAMCKRRGFTLAQRRFLEYGLEQIGLKDW